MNHQRIRKIVVLGGGAAGWMSAAVLCKVLSPQHCRIELVESEEIGIIGVGEATIAGIHWLNRILGIDEDEFMRAAQATFKLGIDFVGWSRPGSRYYHPFGRYGVNLKGVEFHHLWVRAWLAKQVQSPADYCMTTVAAIHGKFDRPDRAPKTSPVSRLSYAYHLDAMLYAKYLRKYAEARGVKRTEGKVVKVDQNPETGFITALHTHKGEKIEGDLFLDASGQRALLIQDTLKTGVTDLSHLLPCDRAWAVPSEGLASIDPSTRSTAREAGWQWRIPLQHRIGNGHVFCSEFMSEDEAHAILMRNLDGRPLADARLIKFRTGRSRQVWNKNVIAVGLSAGFLEPLEATTIHIILGTLNKILTYFPTRDFDARTVGEFNKTVELEFETIKDFLILHYHASPGRTGPFWHYFHNLQLPDHLVHMMETFRRTARIIPSEWDQFKEASWFSIFMGQEVFPTDYYPPADGLEMQEILSHLAQIKRDIREGADAMPAHAAYIRGNCLAPLPQFAGGRPACETEGII